MKIFFALIILAFAGTAQSPPPSPQLIDEFGSVACDDMIARIDAAASQLARNSISRLVVKITPKSNHHASAYKDLLRNAFADRLKHAVADRILEISRVSFSRGEPIGEFKVQFWLVSDGALLPEAFLPWPAREINFAKQYRFASNGEDGICPPFVPDEYANVVNSHPYVGAKIVIFPFSKATGIQNAQWWRKYLTTKYLISPERLRIVIKKPRGQDRNEFWIVPLGDLKTSK